MKLSFVPGGLYLEKIQDGYYQITMQGKEILRTTSEKKAIAEYNKLRRELETKFPAHELTPEEKTELLKKFISDVKVGIDHNSRREEKRGKPRSTRTFR